MNALLALPALVILVIVTAFVRSWRQNQLRLEAVADKLGDFCGTELSAGQVLLALQNSPHYGRMFAGVSLLQTEKILQRLVAQERATRLSRFGEPSSWRHLRRGSEG